MAHRVGGAGGSRSPSRTRARLASSAPSAGRPPRIRASARWASADASISSSPSRSASAIRRSAHSASFAPRWNIE
ncbi:hypothetical protein AB0J42_10465 [Nonomuraea sp. NPDC049649]|uniref:hypothetical protein n=1 Tax=Nonomuraea sp. NPDC049649 TaxID=3155776 RepID=UPI0034208430